MHVYDSSARADCPGSLRSSFWSHRRRWSDRYMCRGTWQRYVCTCIYVCMRVLSVCPTCRHYCRAAPHWADWVCVCVCVREAEGGRDVSWVRCGVVFVYVCVYVCVYVWACVCVCVCACMCVREVCGGSTGLLCLKSWRAALSFAWMGDRSCRFVCLHKYFMHSYVLLYCLYIFIHYVTWTLAPFENLLVY